MIEEVVESKFTYDDVVNKLNDVNFFENIKQQEKIESLFFKHENQFIIINLSSIENLINGAMNLFILVWNYAFRWKFTQQYNDLYLIKVL